MDEFQPSNVSVLPAATVSEASGSDALVVEDVHVVPAHRRAALAPVGEPCPAPGRHGPVRAGDNHGIRNVDRGAVLRGHGIQPRRQRQGDVLRSFGNVVPNRVDHDAHVRDPGVHDDTGSSRTERVVGPQRGRATNRVVHRDGQIGHGRRPVHCDRTGNLPRLISIRRRGEHPNLAGHEDADRIGARSSTAILRAVAVIVERVRGERPHVGGQRPRRLVAGKIVRVGPRRAAIGAGIGWPPVHGHGGRRRNGRHQVSVQARGDERNVCGSKHGVGNGRERRRCREVRGRRRPGVPNRI